MPIFMRSYQSRQSPYCHEIQIYYFDIDIVLDFVDFFWPILLFSCLLFIHAIHS